MQTEIGASLFICDPSQVHYATFNAPTDPNMVGYLSEITGFDSPEVRENAQNINAGDGGHHGPFWHGRRPFTISGMVVPTTPVTARSAAQTKIDTVMNQCLRQDGYLVYTPSDGIVRYLRFRKQQPHRITSGQSAVQKNFQIAGVCRDWRFYAAGAPHTISANFTSGPVYTVWPNMVGDAPAPVIATVIGPADQPVISNMVTGTTIAFTNLPGGTIPAGYTLTIDMTGEYLLAYRSDGLNVYGYIDIPTSTVLDLSAIPGYNEWRLICNNPTSSTGLQISWNDAWS